MRGSGRRGGDGKDERPRRCHRGPSRGVSDGTRTRDHRHHKPVLYQLSYAHHACRTFRRSALRGASRRSLTDGTPELPTAFRGGAAAQISSGVPNNDHAWPSRSDLAAAWACSVVGPGGGTKMVCR